VRPAFADGAIVENEDAIRVHDSAYTMTDDQRGATRDDIGQPAQNLGLGLGIDRTQRVVEDENTRITGNGASESRTLALSA
jgi:hypothetical protein